MQQSDTSAGVTESLRTELSLSALKREDPAIQEVVFKTTFCSVYVLDEKVANWHRADVEGSLYIVRRLPTEHTNVEEHQSSDLIEICLTQPRLDPRSKFRLIVLNQRHTTNLVEDITPSWDVSVEANYLFYRIPLIGHQSGLQRKILGLWFFYDWERAAVHDILGNIINKISSESTKMELMTSEERIRAGQEIMSLLGVGEAAKSPPLASSSSAPEVASRLSTVKRDRRASVPQVASRRDSTTETEDLLKSVLEKNQLMGPPTALAVLLGLEGKRPPRDEGDKHSLRNRESSGVVVSRRALKRAIMESVASDEFADLVWERVLKLV